ncbi:phospholipid-translocating P-type ATPase [Xylariales sp. AK1849]|nr:phospholipid-translocating P-type ATPase [Xylariales sp. AK1849]
MDRPNSAVASSWYGGKSLKNEIGVAVSSFEDPRVKRCRGWTRRQKNSAGEYYHTLYQKWVVEFLFRQYPLSPSEDGRHIPLNIDLRQSSLIDQRRKTNYISNFIQSSRYTVWSFIPKQLYFQFSKLANFYFLVMAILQAIPGLSTTGKYTTLATLVPFIAISMAKEGYDDYKRYKLDKGENRSEVAVFDLDKNVPRRCNQGQGDGEAIISSDIWSNVQWQHIRVGDIIRLQRNENVPADIVLLHATGPNGIAYIETMALDGETNLKSKQACPLLSKRCDTLAKLRTCNAEIVSEDPNIDLYNYDGHVTVDGKTMPLTLNEVVYRGSTLRNTTYAMGLVINTGEECKIRMNANKEVHAKMPNMQQKINRIVLLLVAFVALLSIGLTIENRKWQSYSEPIAWSLAHAWVPVGEIFVGFIIMFNTLIPLSLIVSLEIIKIGQLFLMQDVEMYDAETNTPMVANTTTILEDLGQVNYVFSDKTGTLTENKMRLRKLSVAGTAYLHDMDQPSQARSTTESLLRHIYQNPNTTFSKKAKRFLLSVALCHTCLPETGSTGSIEYQAASPDEIALVRAAQDLGYMVVDRSTRSIALQIKSSADGPVSTETYEILDVIEFSSQRKRMSIVIRMPDGRICVLCKGADSVILPRLKLAHLAMEKATDVCRKATIRRSVEAAQVLQSMDIARTSSVANSQIPPILSGNPTYAVDGLIDESIAKHESVIFERCFQHIEDFASEGLRTLLYAYRYIDNQDYASWKQTFQAATTSLVDRQKRIEEAGEMIEQELDLAGATAIEDKLQVGVPETIDNLRRANIKVWMLTGDKRETAINIAHSAKICKSFSEMYVLDITKGNLQNTMTSALVDVGRGMIAHSVVVVDGYTLAMIEVDDTLKAIFFDLAVRVDSVICCRASPSQKADLVKCIRDTVPSSITLAIGDGSNDIAMIQASHVGIGISGREGLQAARISDFSIAKFRFLQRLLFVHGRWNYTRTGKYVLATFWKEMLFYIAQAQYQHWNGYTGTSLFESTSLAVFNTLFTSLAVILPGIFEKDLQASTLLAVPELYAYGQRNGAFSYRKYIAWTLMAIVESVIIYKVIYTVYANGLATSDLFAFGQLIFTVCVVFINIKLFILEMHHKTIISCIGWTSSVGGWFAWNLFMSGTSMVNATPSPYPVRNGFIHNFGHQLLWWVTGLLALAAVMVFELCVKSVRRVYFPNDEDVEQENEHLHDGLSKTDEGGEHTKVLGPV